jgi:hypothetical protein
MRPTWILVAPGLAVLLILFGKQPIRLRMIAATCLLAGLAATLTPWTIRNAFVTGHFVPTTLWVGPSLYDGLNPEAKGDSDMQFFDRDQLMQTMSEYEMDQEYRRRACAVRNDRGLVRAKRPVAFDSHTGADRLLRSHSFVICRIIALSASCGVSAGGSVSSRCLSLASPRKQTREIVIRISIR